MTFRSILFPETNGDFHSLVLEPPDFLGDLNLDQIIETITLNKKEYDLKPFFYTPLSNTDDIAYRHEIMKDFEQKTLLASIKSFSQKMRTMREHLAHVEKLYYRKQKQSWFLDAAEIYREAMISLMQDLSRIPLKSRGFVNFQQYLAVYIHSLPFELLVNEIRRLKDQLSSIQYCMLIKDNSIEVRKYDAEVNYTAEIENLFKKFRQDEVNDYTVKFQERQEMNHIEAKVLDFLALLYPETFQNLEDFCHKHLNFLDETINRFDREVQFYIAYLEYVECFQHTGLKFCYPKISTSCKEISNTGSFDMALAFQLINQKKPIVCNDFYLKGDERIIVVSGPNQGGKTTFARSLGQLFYLASLGCPVPGRKAQLFLHDKLFTHFEKEEDIENLRGKLQDDLVRIHKILTMATSNSIIIMNEIFTSTTLEDAILLSKNIMEQIIALDLLCISVTFLDEMSTFSPKIVSMVSTMSPDQSTLRTFKILRKPADGLSYALSIAEKYNLTYEQLKERLTS
jgi:DNA mismatch repair ATPase MutS